MEKRISGNLPPRADGLSASRAFSKYIKAIKLNSTLTSETE